MHTKCAKSKAESCHVHVQDSWDIGRTAVFTICTHSENVSVVLRRLRCCYIIVTSNVAREITHLNIYYIRIYVLETNENTFGATIVFATPFAPDRTTRLIITTTNRILIIIIIIIRLFEFRKEVSNRQRCYKLVPPDYHVEITHEEKCSDYHIVEGKFLTPLELYLPGLVPEAARYAHFQMLLPLRWPHQNHRPMCVHFAGTGDHVSAYLCGWHTGGSVVVRVICAHQADRRTSWRKNVLQNR